jgi:hypothetical protein
MEHQTGLDGPDGTDELERASAVYPGEPKTMPEANDEELRKPQPEPAAEPRLPPVPVPATGEPRVDAALKLLDRLPGLPVSEHSELFEQVHAQLSDVLGELDSGPAAPAGG